MKIGVTQLCIAGTIDEVVEKTRRWGYEVLELGIKSEGGILNLQTPEHEKKEMVRKIEDAGLELVSLVAGPVPEFGLFDPDSAVRAKGMDRCRSCLDTAAVMGADTILLVPGRLTSEIRYDHAMERLIDSLGQLAPDAEQRGVNVAVEQVWNKFLVSPLDMKRVITAVDSERVGNYMDTGNMVFWNFPEHWIRILGPWIKKIHFKDFKHEGGKVAFTQLGEGQVNWPAVMSAIGDVGYDDAVISEVGGDDEQMAETARIMRKLLDQG